METYPPLNPYRFKMSLRLWHPSTEPQEITRTLKLTPRISRAAMESGSSKRRGTYWSCRIAEGDSSSFLPALTESIQSLEGHKQFLEEFVASGGEVEFFVGWFTTPVSGGEIFRWELLERLAHLKVNLSLDVYGDSAAGVAERDT